MEGIALEVMARGGCVDKAMVEMGIVGDENRALTMIGLDGATDYPKHIVEDSFSPLAMRSG